MAVQLARASGAHVTALVRNAAASRELMGHLGATAVEQLSDDFDVIVNGVGGATFGLTIEHVAPRGVVVNIATQDDDETVTFQAKRFDRARGATIYTLNLPDELASHASAASDLARLCTLAAGDGWTARSNSNAHGASPVLRSTPCSTAASAARPCSTSTDRVSPRNG